MDLLDDLSLVTKVARGELVHILESIPETKELVIESCLMRPLDKLVSMSVLNEHGCKRVHQLHMEQTIRWDSNLEHRLFFIRPTIKLSRKICELINAEPSARYSIVFVDQRRMFFDRELERNGLYGIVRLFEFNMSLVPLESDLFSLELPISFSSNMIDGQQQLAKALWHLQSLYGIIPTSFCIGSNSQIVDKIFRNLSLEFGEPTATAEQPISHMFLFDRQLDFVTPFMTCLTYESMLNDKFDYFCGKISFGEVFEAKLRSKSNIKNRVFPLNNSDAIYSTIRNLHMKVVFPFLSAKAKELQSSMDRVSDMKKVEDMKSFVTNELKSLQSQKEQLEMHICACEAILDFTSPIRDQFVLEQEIVRGLANDKQIFERIISLIAVRMDAWAALQLTCLWSICCGGLPIKLIQKFQETFLRAYGYKFLPAIYRLRSKQLLVERQSTMPLLSSIVQSGNPIPNSPLISLRTANKQSKSAKPSFSSISAMLRLCPPMESKTNASENNNEKSIGYMFSDAYVPMICRIVEMTTAEGWNGAKLRRIFGETTPIYSTNPSPARPDNRVRKAVLIGFVGGVTFAEIASLRQFAQNNDFRIIIVTTNIVHRTRFMQQITESI